MHRPALLLLTALASPTFAQSPEITSWIFNPGSDVGYGGYPSNVQSLAYTATDAYVSCTCIPGYDIGPWAGNPNVPANQNFIFKLARNPTVNQGTPVPTPLGHIGVLRNGVSIFNAKDAMSYNNMDVWHRDALVLEGAGFDNCLGHPAPNGEYHNHVSPDCLYDHLNDEVHSPLVGFAFDGYPIYGAYGFANTDGTGGIARMRSSFQLRSMTDRTTLPDGTVLPTAEHGPAIGGDYPLGAFVEDYEYVQGSGDLDGHNGRFCVTPDYPGGQYCYFVTLDAQGDPAFPYILGPTYYGTVQPGNTGQQSGHNIIPDDALVYSPTGVNERESAIQLRLFPDPAESELTIDMGEGILNEVDILDVEGKIIGQYPVQKVHQVHVSLADLAPGIYFAKIMTGEGSSIVRSFVKE